MSQDIIVKVAVIGVLGVGAQWLAWRLRLPAIVLLLVAGLIAGPATGLLRPQEDFGELFQPVVAIAVAIILFEGGLNLSFKDLRGVSTGVRRLVLLGVPLGWLMGALATHFVVGLSWPVAVLFGGIMVVTGPTVIMPLLRQARLAQRPAATLKWEGILNDPIGAILAVLTYEVVRYVDSGDELLQIGLELLIASTIAVVIGFACGRLMVFAFQRGEVPEFLKAPVILALVIVCYGGANMIEHETGLLAVTAMGVALANARVHSIEEMRRFKENITIVLVSGVFIVLTATLTPEVLKQIDWRFAAFVLVMLFAVRPLTVWLATTKSDLSWKEKALVGWIAPRGVVAVAISGFFGTQLMRLGFDEGQQLIPLSFAMVFATVVAHGFTIGWLSRKLGLSFSGPPGLLIVGASRWSVALAHELRNHKIPVTVADRNWHHLAPARQAGVPFFYGEILSEATERRLNMNQFEHLIATTDNDAYNALVCSDFGPSLGRTKVFQLGPHSDEEEDPHGVSYTLRGRRLFGSGMGYDDLRRRHQDGWSFRATRITEEFDLKQFLASRPEGAEPMLIIRQDGELSFPTQAGRTRASEGDVVISFSPPVEREVRSHAKKRKRERNGEPTGEPLKRKPVGPRQDPEKPKVPS